MNEPMAIETPVTLATLTRGAAEERFQAELELVKQNIKNENTDADAKWEITIKVTFFPRSDRWQCDVGVASTSKLAPIQGTSTTMFVGMTRAGRLVAVEQNPNQPSLFPADKPAEGATSK